MEMYVKLQTAWYETRWVHMIYKLNTEKWTQSCTTGTLLQYNTPQLGEISVLGHAAHRLDLEWSL